MKLKIRERISARVFKHMITHKNKLGEVGPDFIVGEPSDPYLRRWVLTPKWLMPIFAIYAHEFCKDDDDVPHDHPYLFNVSWILRIGYFEHQFSSLARRLARRGFDPDYRDDLVRMWRPEGAVVARWGWTAHRVELKTFRALQMQGKSFTLTEGIDAKGSVPMRPHPLTLFFCGPRVREWGFHCPQGWRPWRQYIAPTSYGNRVGKGCVD